MKQLTTRFGLRRSCVCRGCICGVDLLGALAQDAASGDAANGKRLYLADGCFDCHGRAGQGGAMNYPAPAIAKLEMPVESFVAVSARRAERHAGLFDECVVGQGRRPTSMRFCARFLGASRQKTFRS